MILARIARAVFFLTLLIPPRAALFLPLTPPQQDPVELLKEADRLAYLRNWLRAEPVFSGAEQLFLARGDQRNALYAMVGKIRGQLPRLGIQQTSNQLAELLENPLVQQDLSLRLRVLTVKGDT